MAALTAASSACFCSLESFGAFGWPSAATGEASRTMTSSTRADRAAMVRLLMRLTISRAPPGVGKVIVSRARKRIDLRDSLSRFSMRHVTIADKCRWMAAAVWAVCLALPGSVFAQGATSPPIVTPGKLAPDAVAARHRRPRGRRGVAGGDAAHDLHPAGPAAGRAGDRAHRGPAAVRTEPRSTSASSASTPIRRTSSCRSRSATPRWPRPTRSSWCSTPSTTARTRSCSAPTRSASSTTVRWRARGSRVGVSFGGGAAGTQRGGISAFNPNWDGDWTVRAQVTERGWEAEMAIPLKTLRYPTGTGHDVGLQRHAEHPPQERAGVPLGDSARLRHLPHLAGRQGARARPAAAARHQAHSLRAGIGEQGLHARGRRSVRRQRRRGRGREVGRYAQPHARRAP